MGTNDVKVIMEKETQVMETLERNWGVYSRTVPTNIKMEDVNRLIFNLMRKPNSKFENLGVKQMINFALDTLERGYSPEKEHIYPIVYAKNKGTKNEEYVLEAQKGYKGVLFDLERAGLYASFDLVHASEVYDFDKFKLKINHIPSRKRVNKDIDLVLVKGKVVPQHELDVIWVVYRDIETKAVLDIFQMYIDDAIEHGLKYTKASPVKVGASASFIDKDNNWVKNTKAMIIKTALLQGAKTLPKDVVDRLATQTKNIFEDNVRYDSSGKKFAWEEDSGVIVDVDVDDAQFEKEAIQKTEKKIDLTGAAKKETKDDDAGY